MRTPAALLLILVLPALAGAKVFEPRFGLGLVPVGWASYRQSRLQLGMLRRVEAIHGGHWDYARWTVR